jgi:hypothetical protein
MMTLARANQRVGADIASLSILSCLVKGVQIIFASSPVNSDLIRFFPTVTKMSGIASTSLRQASRLCLKQPASAAGLLRSSTTARVAGISQKTVKRGYVSATKKDSAQVNVDTAIRAEQKAFFAETGKLPENQIIPRASAMMSPMAGTALKYRDN